MLKRAFKLVAALIIVALIVGVVLFLHWSRKPPVWYQPPQADSPKVLKQADDFEYNLLAQAQRIRPVTEQWALAVSQADLNAWLASRLPQWLEQQQGVEWPEDLKPPQVRLDGENLHLAIDAGPKTGGRVFTLTINPQMRDDRLWLDLQGVSAGRLPVRGAPAQVVIELIRSLAPGGEHDGTEAIACILAGRQGVDPTMELSDGRRIRLRKLTLRGGSLTLENRTLGRED
jgi:hypothetical protein